MVLELNHAGKTNIEIARQLGCERTVIGDDLRFLENEGGHAIKRHNTAWRREKWVEVIQTILDEVIPYFTSQGIKPSLRTAYYRLRARGLLENTERDYKNLITHTKEARLGEVDRNGNRLYPKLPIDCFADETRELIDHYSDYEPEEVQDPDEYIDELIDALKEGPENYDGTGTKGGRWYGQPEYVEVWVEKFADAPTFEKWLEDKDVNIVVNKGYTSLSFLWENIKRLKEKVKQFGVKHVHVQYFGDFDPSGEDMVKSLRKYFRRFGLSPNIITKVALTQEQIEEYHIPLEPVKESDNRYDSFEAEYGDSGAEIDAFIATDPEALKKIVQDSVDKDYFDQKIYDEMEKKYKTSTPADELREIHDNMFYRINAAFSGPWDREIRTNLEDMYVEDIEDDDDEDDSNDDEDGEDE